MGLPEGFIGAMQLCVRLLKYGNPYLALYRGGFELLIANGEEGKEGLLLEQWAYRGVPAEVQGIRSSTVTVWARNEERVLVKSVTVGGSACYVLSERRVKLTIHRSSFQKRI